MAWRPHGRARVNPESPEAFGICDDCNFQYNLVDLQFQFAWRGNTLQNTGFRVCYECYDKPNEQLRPRILPADPVPVMNPRPGTQTAQEAGTLTAAQAAIFIPDD